MTAENINHLTHAFSILHDLHTLIYKEKDRNCFLNNICHTLVQKRYCDDAGIILMTRTGKISTVKSSVRDPAVTMPNENDGPKTTPACMVNTAQAATATIIRNTVKTCGECPLVGKKEDHMAIRLRLNVENVDHGILCLSFLPATFENIQGYELYESLADMVAFKLHTLDLAEQNKALKKKIERTSHSLAERIKELKCLFAISEIVDDPENSLDEIAQKIIKVLPPAWQYPEITTARLVIQDLEYKTDNFKPTPWSLKAGVDLGGQSKDYLEICYLSEKRNETYGPFLPEEKALLNSVAERLGKTFKRLEMEALLAERERQFRRLVERSLTGISIIKGDRVVYQNSEQERLLGPLPRKIKFTDIENIHSEDVSKVQRFYEKIKGGAFEPADIDFRFYPEGKKHSGIGMKWVYCRSIAIRYKGKDAVLVNMMDITKPKELEYLLRIQDKMSSLGRVAAGIAHEIRNPLSGINIYVNTLEKLYKTSGSDEKVEKILNQLKSASRKIEAVIKRVMDFSKPGEPRLMLADIHLPVKAAIALASATLRKSGIKIENKLANNLPPCLIDTHLIEEVILNLINNAAEAMKQQGSGQTIRIATDRRDDYIQVDISDSGPGVPDELLEKIFDPFYTTKNGSTGIGLNISHRAVSDHGGNLKIKRSRLGGAKFTIEIPVAKKARQK